MLSTVMQMARFRPMRARMQRRKLRGDKKQDRVIRMLFELSWIRQKLTLGEQTLGESIREAARYYCRSDEADRWLGQ